MKEYNVDLKVKKLSKPELAAVVLIILGIIMLLLERWSTIHSFRDLFKILDSLLLPTLGIAILINSSKQIRKIRGSYIRTSSDQFSFKSRLTEHEFEKLTDVKDIKVSLETIKISDSLDQEYLIYLDDYIGNGEQKEIKNYFTELRKKIKNT